MIQANTEITLKNKAGFSKETIGAAIDRFIAKILNPAQASFRLGCDLVRRGEHKEAIYRFKFTLWRQPHHADAWFNLGICHLALNEKAEGVAAIQKSLQLQPKNDTALFLLATLDNGKYAGSYHPHTLPVEVIKAEFAGRAASYEESEILGRGYVGHVSLYEVLRDVVSIRQEIFDTVLDAGCGTGLLGMMVRPFCRHLMGIDLCAEMALQARNLKTERGEIYYESVQEGDVRAFLLQQPTTTNARYDAIVAANLAPVMGGIAPFLDGAARQLRPDGWVFFTVFPLENSSENYRLNIREQRFYHSEAYIRQVSQKSGLIFHSLTRKPLYSDTNGWVVALKKQG
jgi:predicted TPR repeat methyltransferase